MSTEQFMTTIDAREFDAATDQKRIELVVEAVETLLSHVGTDKPSVDKRRAIMVTLPYRSSGDPLLQDGYAAFRMG